jgi:prepilin-type N-terminal cleavage/methylation domain-containing protein
MKLGEKGFTYVELLVAITIMALTSGAAAMTTFQVFKGIERNNDYITAVRHVHNAGYRISHDTQMAQSVTASNLTVPDFLVLSWTEPNYTGEDIYHSVTYFFEDLTSGIGTLKRSHWSSVGANETTLIAKHIYYAPDDPDDTSKVSYQSSVLTIQITALFEDIRETREYRINCRPDL